MYKEEISDLNEEFQDQREAYLKDIREQQLQIDLLNGNILLFYENKLYFVDKSIPRPNSSRVCWINE